MKKLRKLKNKKQVDLAKKLHVSQQTVGAWEVGRAVPSIDTLIAMADYFDFVLPKETTHHFLELSYTFFVERTNLN